MISVQGLDFEFGGEKIFQNADFFLKQGEKVALIGKNGVGKSTFFKLLTGEYSPSKGCITKPKNLKIALLNQDSQAISYHESIFQLALSAFQPQIALQKQLAELEKQLEVDYSDELYQLWEQKRLQYEALGGDGFMHETAHKLKNMGFDETAQQRPYNTFSGGWRMRALLTKMLLEKPDLLLLDEPTNHLDLPSVEWLEQYLIQFPNAFIIISHDRFFLERTTQRTVEIENYQFHEYAGNYAFYLIEKAKRAEIQQAAYENQQAFIQQQQKFIDRFRAKATKAAQVQSKIKQLENLEKIQPVDTPTDTIKLKLSVKVPSGKEVVSTTIQEKSYPGLKLYENTELTIYRGDKIGFIGANGIGKTTLLKMIAGMEPFQGQVQMGYQVSPAFFAQHQIEALDLNKTIFETFEDAIREHGETYVRGLLGCFLFSGDDVYKKVQVLSGGEKARVALTKILLSDANFLILDEPTNHLDIPSVEILADALNNYNGTYIAVSHDRYFLSKITNKIAFLENHQIKIYPGSYEEFQTYQANKPTHQTPQPIKENSTSKTQTPNTFEQNKKLKSEQRKVEKNIASIEAQIESLKHTFLDPEIQTDYKKIASLQQEIEQLELILIEEYTKLEHILNELGQ